MPSPWEPSDPGDLIARYNSGESKVALAHSYGVSQKTVHDFLIRSGVRVRSHADLRRGDVPDSELPSLISRYEGGESVKSLADSFKVTRQRINTVLGNAGVQRRGRSEAEALKWRSMTAGQRAAQVAAANEAARGSTHTAEHREKIAATRERNGTNTSPAELLMAEWMRDLGPIPQKAVGPYNVDLAVASIAVEIHGGGWHGYDRHARRTPERARYILDQGWCLVVIWVTREYRLKPAAADYVRSLVDETSRDPSLVGEYRVIGGDGQDFTALYSDLDQLALVPTGERRRHRRP